MFYSKSSGKYARDICYKYTPKSNSWAQTSGTMKTDRTHGNSDYHPNWGLVMVGGLRLVYSALNIKWSIELFYYSWNIGSASWIERSDVEYTFDGETFHNIPAMAVTKYIRE